MKSAFVAGGVASAAAIGYGILEARLHRLRNHTIPVLPPGADRLHILQVSDLHFRLRTRRLAQFVESLANRDYDLVLATGDLLGEPAAMERCAELLNGLKGRLGRYFVLGSSDYYAPIFKNYFDYFQGKRKLGTRRNRTGEFRDLLASAGWTDLTNKTVMTDLNGIETQITGLDDPYLRRDDRSLLVRESRAEFAACVVHDPSPFRHAARGGFDLIISGHTHGGQVRFPFVGAIVTNSSVPRRYARWLSKVNGSWLFVSPGLGTGKYAPFRFLCPPEASVLELVASS